MFFKKRKEPKDFDRETMEPVIRCSICTGEEVAGFRDLHTGKFHEDRLIRSASDLRDFLEEYGLSQEPRRIY